MGFGLFAVPSIGESYWKGFFPAMVVLGFGMAVTVAPLTTVVMNSVSQDRVGTASGVNNAVARVAGVLGNRSSWDHHGRRLFSRLNDSLSHISLPPDVRQGLQAEEIKLADLQVPDALSAGAKAAVKEAVGGAFLFGFRIVIWICVLLSLASAAVAWLMIPQDGNRHSSG